MERWKPGWLPWLLCLWLSSVKGVQQITNPRIIEHPEDQYVAKNDPATLNCKAEGDPPPIVTWYRNGRPVTTATEDHTSHRMLLPSGQLFFLRIIHNKNNKPDVGVYYCNATNPETRVSVISRNATLEIAVLRDDFRSQPRNTEVAVGDTAVLECNPPRGLPEPRVKWKKGGEVVRAEGRLIIQEAGSLMIQNARKEDSGVYVCIAQNVAGEKESIPAKLLVREKPKFSKSPSDQLVEEEQDVRFECQSNGDPEPTIIWKKEEGQIPQGRSNILEDKSLQITKVKENDQGTYICRAENSVGYVEASATLTVNSQPKFIVTPIDKVVGVGRRVSFRCEVTGNPPPAVFWNKETSEILMFPRQDHGRFSVTDDGTLVIEPVRKEDDGQYICQALSVAGSSYAKARLEVKDVDPRPPPIIHQGPQNQTLPVNSVAMLQCSASGDPPPTIRWLKNMRILALRDPRFALLDSGTLQISDLRRTDTGMYTCKALSETGETAWSAALIVEAPTNPAVIFHRTPEPSTFPGPPSKPSISDTTETSMRLMWKANANHGASPVFAYTVEYFSHETGEGWVVASDSITEQSFTVQTLRPDTAYMFLVRAQNSHGLSLPSQVTAPIRTKGGGGIHSVKPTVPQLDIALVSEKLSGQVIHMKSPEVISSTAVKLNWDVRKSQRFIEGFHIKYRVMPDLEEHLTHGHHYHVEFTIETVSHATSEDYVLRNLKKYTWYEVRIQPFYLTVEGQESNTVRVRTFEDVPSAAPQNIKSTMINNSTVRLFWDPPPKERTNGPLKGYKIFLFANESKFNREIKVNSSTTSFVVDHLVRGMQYNAQILAYNRMGDGVKSEKHRVGDNSASKKEGIFKEPWFIATLIGTIGGTLWIALCFFSIWLYRKRKARKKLHKNGVMTVPVHKSEDTTRLGGLFNTLNAPNYLQKDIANHDVTNVMDQRSKEDALKENLYNTPNVQQPPMKTFYNKNNPNNCTPYATTTLVTSNNLINQQHSSPLPESAFRPIQPENYMHQAGSHSSDSCLKPEISSESNSDNSRNITDKGGECCQQCEQGSPMSDHCRPQDEECLNMGMGKQPVLFLPPPPEHPPPSDIGTPPDSPTPGRVGSPTRYSDRGGHYQRLPQYPPRGHEVYPGDHYVDYPPDPRVGGPRGYNSENRPYQERAPSPKFRTMSPRTQHDMRAYSPRAMSEPERGPTPPVRAYKLVPIRDGEVYRHYSDTEGAPVPPLRMNNPHSPPSPAPEDPMMDRGIQSSLPSLVGEPINRMDHSGLHHPGDYHHHDDYHPRGRGESPVSELDHLMRDYEPDSDLEGHPRRDCHSPTSSVGDVDTVAASWASADDNSDCSSVHSRSASSSDGSFFAEADFASAVAKAAELSGLTVVGSTVSDPNAGQPREKVGHPGSMGYGMGQNPNLVKKAAKHRQRAKRPTSPYSTDSNYSAVLAPRNPYPKSERKRQLQEQANRGYRSNGHSTGGEESDRRQRPNAKSKPQGQHDMPSYNKPNFPMPSGAGSGNTQQRLANSRQRGAGSQPRTPTHPSGNESEASVRTNPLAAFDTRDTPIV